MSGEAPAYLTVGTAVSAKYRGAFCEAKVKVINKKLVKCRVNFKDSTSSIIEDEFVKGNLKIGAPVEAKHPENGNWQDGIITKLNDASVYTVLFDDGDEKTLRRSSLCLQGEKHFHESETLDHLPLTDPENFGTPVVRDRTKRKRTHPSRAEDDGESSESEIFKRLRREEPDNAVGKVVIVETNEKRKNLWFPALIVDPSCTKDAPNRTKDHIVTRSFKDNKYYTVSESSWRSFSSKDHTYKGDNNSLKSAVEKAVLYIETGQLPSTWDLSLLRSKDPDFESEETESSDESSDDEYDEQKDAWLASLHKFMEERGTPINKPPVLGYRDLNLYKLYKLVQDLGGCRKVTDKQQWRYIASKMGIPIHNTPQSYNIKAAYNKYLFAFEDHNRKLGPGFSSVLSRPRRRSSYDRWTPVSNPASGKEEKKEPEKKKEPEEEVKEEPETKPVPKKKTRRKAEAVEQEKEDDEEEDVEEKKDAQVEEKEKVTPRSASKRVAAKSAAKEETDVDRDDEDFEPDFEVGEKVKVQYGRGRTHKVYEAKIVDVQGSDKNARYSVHYLGWNVRYDEVVTSERIVSSLDKRKEKRLARRREQKQKEKELELQRKEKERKEKERLEKEAEKAKKEREKQEREERERKEKEERERKDKERREKKEREEMEKRLKKEQEEKERQEKKERDEREKRDRREKKEEQQRVEELQEEAKRAAEEKSKKVEKKATEDDKGKGKGASKRGRPPTLSPKTVGRPVSPRVSGGGRRSPAATSLYPARSLRSDRNSLSESPYANGLEAVKHRGRRASASGKTKAEELENSGEESEGENENEGIQASKDAPSPEKSDTKLAQEEKECKDDSDEPKVLEPVPEEVSPLVQQPEELERKIDSEMPVFDTKEDKDLIENQPPKSPPKLKKEGGLEEEETLVDEEEEEEEEVKEEMVKLKEEVEEAETKKGKRKSKKSEKEHKLEKEKDGGKKASKRRHSKDLKQEKLPDDTQMQEEEEKVEKKDEENTEESVDPEEAKQEKEEGNATEEKQATGPEEKKKKGRKRGRKSLDEKSKEKGEKKAKKGDAELEGSKKGRRRKRRLEENEVEEKESKPTEEQSPPIVEEQKPSPEEVHSREEENEPEASTSDSRMITASITTPPTTPESSATGISSPMEDEEQEEVDTKAETIQTRLSNKSDSDSIADVASSGSVMSVKNEQLDEVSSSNGTEKPTEAPPVAVAAMVPTTKKGHKGSGKKRRKHSTSVPESTTKAEQKSKRKKGSRRRTTSVSSSVKPGPSSSDTDESSNAENKLAKANLKRVPDSGPDKSHQHQTRTPRPCKYNFAVDVSHISSPDERITVIQKQLIELRKIYLQLKSEVSAIDRRRKRFRRKEREAQAAALMAARSLANISNSTPASSAS